MMMLFVFLFFILFFFSFELFNVAVPDLPLCNLSSEIISDWGFSGSSSLLDIWINSLNLSSFVIELVSHGLFDSLHIFS